MTNIYSRKMKVYIDIKYYTEMFGAVKLNHNSQSVETITMSIHK